MANPIHKIQIDENTSHQLIASTRYAVCHIGSSDNIKIAILEDSSSLTLETGVRVTVKFEYGNESEAPTLNIDNTGVKEIYWHGEPLPSHQYWQDGAVLDFVYYEDHWNLIGVAKDTVDASEINYSIDDSIGDGEFTIDKDTVEAAINKLISHKTQVVLHVWGENE